MTRKSQLSSMVSGQVLQLDLHNHHVLQPSDIDLNLQLEQQQYSQLLQQQGGQQQENQQHQLQQQDQLQQPDHPLPVPSCLDSMMITFWITL